MTEPSLAPSCLVVTENVWGSALHAMRSGHAGGAAVLVATMGAGRKVLGQSRFAAAAVDLAPSDADRLCTSLAAWAASVAPTSGPVVVLPLSDRLLELVSEGRRCFDDRFVIAAPEPRLVASLVDKEQSLRLAERAGLDVPAWTVVRTDADLVGALRLDLPLIVRPTGWATTGTDYFKLRVCRTADEVRKTCREALGGGATLLVQELVEHSSDSAVEFGLVWRSVDGSTTAVVTGRKRRQSHPDGGVMAWGETAELPDVDAAACRFLDETGFTGLGGIEFIRADDRLWFIEFNPRLEAIHFLATRAGVDTVRMAFEDLGRGFVPRAVPRQQQASAWIGSAWLARLQADPRRVPLLVRDRVAFARSPRRVRAVWAWDDPVPGLVVTGRILRSSARALWEELGRVASRAVRRSR